MDSVLETNCLNLDLLVRFIKFNLVKTRPNSHDSDFGLFILYGVSSR